MFGLFSKKDNSKLQSVIKDAFLVDVRTPGEFAGGNVEGSINIPLDEVPARLEEFKEKEHVVVFCRSGNRSGQAQHFLLQNGIKNVINGGSWQNVRDTKANV